MTELSFLLELLLNHKLPKATREAVTARIKDVEATLSTKNYAVSSGPLPGFGTLVNPNPTGIVQAPSTIAAMARNGFQEAQPVPIEQIAQTPAAAAALASRQQAMQGTMDKATGRPRKF